MVKYFKIINALHSKSLIQVCIKQEEEKQQQTKNCCLVAAQWGLSVLCVL